MLASKPWLIPLQVSLNPQCQQRALIMILIDEPVIARVTRPKHSALLRASGEESPKVSSGRRLSREKSFAALVMC